MAAKRFIHVDQFNSNWVKFAGASSFGEITENQTSNIDYICPFDLCLTGAILIVNGGKIGDRVSLQIRHPQAGLLDEFVSDWYIAEGADFQLELQLNYPANLQSGLIIRTVYSAASTVGTRKCALNYFLHKVLASE